MSSPGGVLIALTPAQKGSIPPTPSTHRLRPGLPGYLIPFTPLAFAPQRQTQSRKSPSPLVFLPISTHFTATLGIPLSSPALKIHRLSPALLSQTYNPPTRPLRPIIPDNARHLRITAAAGTLHSSQKTELYDPKTFFTHAALLRQTFVHCGRFPTAASRRSLGRVSVPVWPFILSDRLLIVALVGHYPAN
ncbi:hypothetical protein Lal_00003837 [Lupinus albus]|nr:hypothetical protein Lal_00003837 [Lupinus albus]